MLLTDMNPRSCLLSFSLSIFVLLIIFTSKNANAQLLVKSCFNSNSDKGYAANLNSLLSSLSSHASGNSNNYKFHNSTAGGGGRDAVYGLYLCRGDVNKADCQTCVQTASKDILTECPNDKTAIVWYDNCLLRYSNQTDFPDTRWFLWNTQNSPDPKSFNDFVGNMLNDLATQTSYGVSGKKFAVKESNFTAFDELFSLAQCIPDISSLDCDVCLRSAIRQFPTFCDGCLGARVLSPVCYIRFESYLFYNIVATPGAPHLDNFSKRPPSGLIKKVMQPPQ